MADYELELVLFISDPDLSPDEMTKQLGLTPSKVSWKGARQDDPPIPKLNLWRIDSPASSEDSTVQIQWDALRHLILPMKEKIRELPKTAKTNLTVIVYAHKYIPGLEISVETTRQIADFGVPLEVSIYDWVERI